MSTPSQIPKPYSQDLLEEAIRLVKSNALTLRDASRTFNIPLTTLGDKIRGKRPVKARSKFLLTDNEETKLVQWIRTYAERSMGRTGEDVRDKVKEILDMRGVAGRRDDGRPGRDWLISFRKRHPELSIRTPQALGKERALVTTDGIKTWFDNMEAFLNKEDPTLLKSADRIFNADETGFSLCPKTKKVIAPTGMRHVYALSNNTRQQLTVLACCSAAGEFAPPMIIFPRKRMPTTDLLQGFEDGFMQISPNGWVNSDIFKTWIRDVFLPLVKDKQKPVVLFVDGHKSHNSDLSTLELCDANGVILYGLLAHASHILQPLDLSVFGSMKSEWPNITKRHLDREEEMPSIHNFATLLKQVWETCAKPERGLKGFVKSGIFPFNPNNALSCGKMETSKIFEANGQQEEESLQLEPIPPTQPAPPLAMLDNIAVLIHIADHIGAGRCDQYISAMKARRTPTDDKLFKSLETVIGNIYTSCCADRSPAQTSAQPVASSSAGSMEPSDLTMDNEVPIEAEESNADPPRAQALLTEKEVPTEAEESNADTPRAQTLSVETEVPTATEQTNLNPPGVQAIPVPSLETILAPPQLPRNKSGKVKDKTVSLTMAYSSKDFRSMMKRKEEKAQEAEESKKRRKLERLERKEKKMKELKEQKEKRKAERDRKKEEKRVMMEKIKADRKLKAQKKKEDSSASDDDEIQKMVLMSDCVDDDDDYFNLNACRECGKEDGGTEVCE